VTGSGWRTWFENAAWHWRAWSDDRSISGLIPAHADPTRAAAVAEHAAYAACEQLKRSCPTCDGTGHGEALTGVNAYVPCSDCGGQGG
jgi:hypothetical protein